MNTHWPIYAFDNYFKGADRDYPLAGQWDILQELGYDKHYFSIPLDNPAGWEPVRTMRGHSARTGLGVSAVYTVLSFEEAPAIGNMEKLISLMDHGDTLELAVSFGWTKELSNEAHDGRVLEALRPVVQETARRGIALSFYPHFNFWLERIEDCVRLAERIAAPHVRVTFCGYHWYAVDGQDLPGKIRMAAPWLHRANLCGSRPTPGGPMPASIETVGEGEFPAREYLRLLHEAGFQGDIGFQGYGIGGNPPANLKRSIECYRKILQGVD